MNKNWNDGQSLPFRASGCIAVMLLRLQSAAAERVFSLLSNSL